MTLFKCNTFKGPFIKILQCLIHNGTLQTFISSIFKHLFFIFSFNNLIKKIMTAGATVQGCLLSMSSSWIDFCDTLFEIFVFLIVASLVIASLIMVLVRVRKKKKYFLLHPGKQCQPVSEHHNLGHPKYRYCFCWFL